MPATPPPRPNALRICLELEGIEGESTEPGCEKQIEVLSYEQGVQQTVIRSIGGGLAAGRPVLPDARVRKPLDRTSPQLLLACASGRQFAQATFTFRGMGTSGRAWIYTVSLQSVLITQVTQIAGAGPQYPLSFGALDAGRDDAGMLDEVSLAYERIVWEYQPLDSAGVPMGAPVRSGWDSTQNKPV
jgi:type VI secretion system secreted protein Hcp